MDGDGFFNSFQGMVVIIAHLYVVKLIMTDKVTLNDWLGAKAKSPVSQTVYWFIISSARLSHPRSIPASLMIITTTETRPSLLPDHVHTDLKSA